MKGEPLGAFFAPVFLDVTNGQQFFKCNTPSTSCVNGRTRDPADADREFIGSANPDFTLGLSNNGSWGSIDFSWLWRGEFGGKVFNNTALVYQTKSNATQGRNFLAAALADRRRARRAGQVLDAVDRGPHVHPPAERQRRLHRARPPGSWPQHAPVRLGRQSAPGVRVQRLRSRSARGERSRLARHGLPDVSPGADVHARRSLVVLTIDQ